MTEPDPGREQALVFGEAADDYDEFRPSYPPSLVARALAEVDGPVRRVLEVGAGTGKATRLLARHRVRVDAVEPDPAMAAVHRRRVRHPGVRLHVGRFEAFPARPGVHDVVLAAQSWHWVDPRRGIEVAHRALRPGGALALLWNRPAPRHDPELAEALQAAYRAHAPHLAFEVGPDRWSDPGRGPVWRGGRWAFGPARTFSVRWSRRLSTEAYLRLLATHSDHRLLDPATRTALHGALAEVVDRRGGVIDEPHRTVLWVAQARP